jgi:hypothetical protein
MQLRRPGPEATSRKMSTAALLTACFIQSSEGYSFGGIALSTFGSFAGAYVIEKINQKHIARLGNLVHQFGIWTSNRASYLATKIMPGRKEDHFKLKV